METTPGTPVTAPSFMVGDAVATVAIDRYLADYPRGMMVPVTGGGTPIRQGTTFVQTTDLCYEELFYALTLSMATPTVSGAGADKTWTFAPVLTGPIGNKTATAEWAAGDGAGTSYGFPGSVTPSTGFHVTAQAPFCFCSGLDVNFAFNAIATATYRYEARMSQFGVSTVPNMAAGVLLGRERIAGNQFKLYFDTSFASIGTTPLLGTVRSGRLTYVSGIAPDYTADGRASLDFTQMRYGPDRFFTLQLVMELNAASAAEIKSWVQQNAGGSAIAPNTAATGAVAPRYIRLEAISPNPLGTTARKLWLDGAFIYLQPPVFSQTDKTELVTLNLRTEYDSGSAKSYQATIVNSISSLTGI
jgi:hypothetical protein